jgi:mono/diheme cytochrome c family protein
LSSTKEYRCFLHSHQSQGKESSMRIVPGFALILSFLLGGCAFPTDGLRTIAAALPTPASARVDPAETVSAVALAAGIAVYRQQYCGVCHRLDAAETRGTFGPSHNGVAVAAVSHLADPTYVGTATTIAEYLYESIVSPEVHVVAGYAATPHRMPAFAHLPAEDIDALVYLLLHQK